MPSRITIGTAAMRVLWAIKGLGPGGAEHLLARWARVTRAPDISYHAAYVLSWKDTLVGALEDAGVVVHPLGVTRGYDPRWVARLRDLIRTGGYDVVHAHSPLVAGVVRPLVRLLPADLRPAVVTTEHNMWGSYRPTTRALDALTARLDDARVAVSTPVRSSLPSDMRRNTEVIVQGIVPDDLRPLVAQRAQLRAELGIEDDEIVVVTIANLRPTKAYDELLSAAHRVIADNARVRFVAVGQGPLEQEIRAQHEDLGLGERFNLLGYREDATSILAASDLFVLASRHEGFPIALMESLALGVPVVVTAVGGVPAAVTDGREGLVVPPGRPDLLAEAIATVAGDAHRRARMAEAALTRSRAFDLRDAVRRTEDLYREVASANRNMQANPAH